LSILTFIKKKKKAKQKFENGIPDDTLFDIKKPKFNIRDHMQSYICFAN